jgi:hypothetical protein
LAELAAPDLAETVEDLWRVLLASRSRGDTVPMGAASLLTKHHGRGEPDAVITALLLCTCRRWKHCTGPLIKDVVAEGVLSDDDLDGLALLLLSGDIIQFGTRTGPSTVPLQVRPPLHRWAAGHLLRQRPEQVSSLLDEAIPAPANMAGAIVNGLLDSIDVLPPEKAAALHVVALEWPLGTVRRHALEILASVGDVDEAARRAAADPDATVRRWKPRPPASSTGGPSGGQDTNDNKRDSLQESLLE